MRANPAIEKNLRAVLALGCAPSGPPILADAMRYAVFPGGSRTRPRICMAVADACGGAKNSGAMAAATSLELLHCASLVHDDLPCFDDADIRRGKPSVHSVFGEAIAVLVGDALIVLAFESLARGLADAPEKIAPITLLVAEAVGAPRGIIAGQAWESEPQVNLKEYHRSKTSSLFIAACAAGAVATGSDPTPWRVVGAKIGEAYQAIDDALDVVGTVAELGKPVQQDARNGRPNLANDTSVAAVGYSVMRLIEEASAAIPAGADAAELKRLLNKAVGRFAVVAADVQAA